MSTDTTSAPTKKPSADEPAGLSSQILREIMGGGAVRTVLAILCGFIVGAILIIATSEEVAQVSGYFFSRPMDTVSAAWAAVSGGYGALFRGSIFNPDANSFAASVRPITETLRLGAPLIAAGLGIALSFRVGLFNIGGQGQLLLGVVFASYASFAWPLPYGLHLIVAVVFGILGAALWGSIVGLLKATTGAHEVIVTIMLNYVAFNLVTWLMRSGFLHDDAAGGNPQTVAPLDTAQLPPILGPGFSLHAGFLLVVAATIFYWWLMERSTIGYRFRTVGLNPNAARTAGMNVPKIYVVAMAASAAFVGIAGVNQTLGRAGGVTPSIDAGIGFDGITVALLGGGGAVGIFFAGLLFGAMKAGSPMMQIADVSPEVLLVVQGVIVLFIAAPPLVRAIFRLPTPVPAGPIKTFVKSLFTRGKNS
ncbi:ABC transporter permease [Cryobacterium melibiosiphilum]|uniref:ABC transporter permease n=1 Tax=Cryobacterium melibiosiphilum TaxID=995039 RepID=A0A3A5MNX9_9MICO|nr:ABC transporter permease [Cryobacterium melibiosiphilum]RJT87766.1 ABC transporter permease [Cryobacterium melibiosiphilum]